MGKDLIPQPSNSSGRRQAETELADAHEQLNELSAQATSISAAKRKLEGELQTLHSDLDELLNEAKNRYVICITYVSMDLLQFYFLVLIRNLNDWLCNFVKVHNKLMKWFFFY